MPIKMADYALAGIQTKYLGSTNTKGPRVRVRRSDHKQGDPVKIYSYDHGQDPYGAHVVAAEQYLAEVFPDWEGDYSAAYLGDGYVFVRAVKES